MFLVHPLLLAAFPILFLYSRNADEVPLRELWVPLLIAEGSAAAIVLLSKLVLHDPRRAGILTSVFLLLFFSYGHVWELVKGRVLGSVIIDRDLYLLLVWAAISTGLLLIAFGARRNLNEVTTILNVVAVFLVASSAYSIIRTGGGTPVSKGNCPAPLTTPATPPMAAKPQRDIYYLIFDRYGGSKTLTESYGFDNSGFLSELRRRGFYVADDSRANYPRSAHSLASSLNAGYLDCLTRTVDPNESDWGAIFGALADHQVGRFLQRNDYTYVHIGSWWDETAKSPFADLNFSYEGRIGFPRLLYSTTLARPFGEYLKLSDPRRVTDYKRVFFQLRTLRETRSLPGPKFVFAHFLLPHEPYIFDRHGKFQTEVEEQRRGRTGAYVEQLRFTNQVILQLFDDLLSGPDSSHPIIVLQSDEGPHPVRYDSEGPYFDWSRASTREINETLRILNAYYLPGIDEPGLDPRITPANTFRKIFDLYFGTGFGSLPNEVFVYADDDHPYRFKRVTEQVWDPPPRPPPLPGG